MNDHTIEEAQEILKEFEAKYAAFLVENVSKDGLQVFNNHVHREIYEAILEMRMEISAFKKSQNALNSKAKTLRDIEFHAFTPAVKNPDGSTMSIKSEPYTKKGFTIYHCETDDGRTATVEITNALVNDNCFALKEYLVDQFQKQLNNIE